MGAQAADKKKETVIVSKDVITLKGKFEDMEFSEAYGWVNNNYQLSDVEKAEEISKLLGDTESTVLPKFVTYLAKKKRLESLKEIVNHFVIQLYKDMSIMPAVVYSAEPLTEEQEAAVKEKMVEKTGARDVKLVSKVDASILGGLKIEYDFMDPEN